MKKKYALSLILIALLSTLLLFQNCGSEMKQKTNLNSVSVVPVCVGAETQIFAPNMIGFICQVTFKQKTGACQAGWHVCSAQEWVERRNNNIPSHHFWTSDSLYYNGDANACYVSLEPGDECEQQEEAPMRVCTTEEFDPLGNECNWQNCGLKAATPNEYFGGCDDNLTAGVLCCL